MSFRTQKFISRQDVRSEPMTLFVFGDNMKHTGRGGQAAAMRGETNTVGIPTKWAPYSTPNAFFTDADFDIIAPSIKARFKILAKYLAEGGDVVWPADGIGTGLAELQQRAPRIWNLIETLRQQLEASDLAAPTVLADELIAWVEAYAKKVCPEGCLPTPGQEREINLFARVTCALRATPALQAAHAEDFVRRCRAYLDDAPLDGRHSDAAGANAYELIEEAIEHLKGNP